MAALKDAGLAPVVLAGGTGVVCDVGSGESFVVLRADIDALPLQDEKAVAYRSQVPGACHACGHDVHTAIVLGAGLFLAANAVRWPGPAGVPARRGADARRGDGRHRGGLDRRGVRDLRAALRPVAGGRPRRPEERRDHGCRGRRRGDASPVPAGTPPARTTPSTSCTCCRRWRPGCPMRCRAWSTRGPASAWCGGASPPGTAHNAIPREGKLAGTLRMLDRTVWAEAPELVNRLVQQIVAPYGAVATVSYERGVPPVVNDAGSHRPAHGCGHLFAGAGCRRTDAAVARG